MRQWIDLVTEAWHNTYPVAGGQVDVYKNPTPAEFKKLIAETVRNNGQQNLPLRASIGPDGTLYVWDAYVATHFDLIDGHGLPTVGGYIYLAPDHIFFNDLNWEYDEESDDPERIYRSGVRRYYEATKGNAALQRIYGPNMTIIGADDEDPLGLGNRFVVTDDFIAKHVS